MLATSKAYKKSISINNILQAVYLYGVVNSLQLSRQFEVSINLIEAMLEQLVCMQKLEYLEDDSCKYRCSNCSFKKGCCIKQFKKYRLKK